MGYGLLAGVRVGRGLGREFEEGNGDRANSVVAYTISLSRPSDVVQLDQGKLQSLMEPVHVSRGAKGQQLEALSPRHAVVIHE